MSEMAIVQVGPSLGELAATANREHGLALEAGTAMVEHAIRAGEALLVARESVSQGGWRQWISDNLDVGVACVGAYMRLARYQDAVREGGFDGIDEARRYLAHAPAVRGRSRNALPPWMSQEAERLAQEGMSGYSIAKELDVPRQTVYRWIDPASRERAKASAARSAARRVAAARALREQEREQAIKRAVRKAGGAIAKLYADAERTQDDLARAQREATDPGARRELSEAGALHRQYRDKIVRALGVS